MKKISEKLLFCSLMALLFYSCKNEPITTPSFDVKLDSLTFKIGRPVTFKITGYADYISFYPGTKVANYPTLLGNRYQYKDRTTANGTAYLQFNSLQQNIGQSGSLSILVSSDFNGSYDANSVKQANWIDITNRFTLSSGTPTTPIGSGLADISDFKDKPVFFAFKYTANTGSQQPTWTINNLSSVFYASGNDNEIATRDTFTVATLSPVWHSVDINNAAQQWSVSTTQLKFTGGNQSAASNEDWVISGDLYLNRVPTDKALPIKTYTDAMLTQYVAMYNIPGIYKVDFVASNINVASNYSKHQSFIITIVK